MTCREKLTLEHSRFIDDIYGGGCRGCPHEYGYLPRPEQCTNEYGCEFCTACWDREIPGTAPTEIKKENDIMPAESDYRKMTKAELADEIKYAREHIREMEAEIKKLERYKKNEELATEMKAIHASLMDAGFTNDQAFELMKCALQAAAMGGVRT